MSKLAEDIGNVVHTSVLVKETIEYLCPIEDGVYIDATIGLGGHTKSILEATNCSSKVIGFDVDEDALAISKSRLSQYGNKVEFINKNFSDIDLVMDELGIEKVDGIIADLGMSSFQLEQSGRGFSFLKDEPLDMRMDPKLQFTAYDLIKEMSFEELRDVIKDYGEENFAKQVAQAVVKSRQSKPIQTSKELAAIVSSSIPKKFHPKKIHPATKTFQALRIAVNNELQNLKTFINKAINLLKKGGRLIIISFQSLEDKIVKSTFKYLSSNCICPPDLPSCGCDKESVIKIITKSPITPGEEEIIDNPRSRSSKMRVGERI